MTLTATAPLLMPRPRTASKQLPEWSVALRNRRLQLGLSQEAVMVASGDSISQKAVSDLENARVHLMDMALGRVVALARALNWSLSEFQAATRVDLGVPSAELVETDEPTPVYSLEALAAPKPEPDGVSLSPNNGQHPRNWKLTFMDGDEMMPAIRDGESIYFDADLTTPVKGVYVIADQGRAYVRRYSQLPSGPAWTADNSVYAHQFIPASDTVQVLGRVYRVVGIREDPALLN